MAADGKRTVADIMSRPVVTARADETVSAAADRMRAQSVGSVVVVDGDNPVGILTERDLVRLAAAGAATGASVSEWMTGEPDSVAPNAEGSSAVARLSEHGDRPPPV